MKERLKEIKKELKEDRQQIADDYIKHIKDTIDSAMDHLERIDAVISINDECINALEKIADLGCGEATLIAKGVLSERR